MQTIDCIPSWRILLLPSSFLEGSNRCGSTREFTFMERRAATVSCAKSARCSVQILTIREVTEYVFDTPEETVKLQRQNVYVSPLWIFAISAGHSFIQSGLKWALYAFFFLAFPAHGDPLRLDAIAVLCPLIGIITKKIRNDGPKTKKSRCSNDGDFGETKMTVTPS